LDAEACPGLPFVESFYNHYNSQQVAPKNQFFSYTNASNDERRLASIKTPVKS
jgi:hypothetical protein